MKKDRRTAKAKVMLAESELETGHSRRKITAMTLSAVTMHIFFREGLINYEKKFGKTKHNRA